MIWEIDIFPQRYEKMRMLFILSFNGGISLFKSHIQHPIAGFQPRLLQRADSLSLPICVSCQQPLNNRWDPHPLGLSPRAFNRLTSRLELLCLGKVGELAFYLTHWTCMRSACEHYRPLIYSANNKGNGDIRGWCSVTGNWTSEMLAPSSSSWLCEILAAVDLLCHVKDERSCLPSVKYRLLSSFVPSTLLVRPLAACLFGWKDTLVVITRFLPSI